MNNPIILLISGMLLMAVILIGQDMYNGYRDNFCINPENNDLVSAVKEGEKK